MRIRLGFFDGKRNAVAEGRNIFLSFIFARFRIKLNENHVITLWSLFENGFDGFNGAPLSSHWRIESEIKVTWFWCASMLDVWVVFNWQKLESQQFAWLTMAVIVFSAYFEHFYRSPLSNRIQISACSF